MIATYVVKGMQQPVSFLSISQCGSFVTEDPTGAESYLRAIDIQRVVDEFAAFEKVPESFKQKLGAQLRLR